MRKQAAAAVTAALVTTSLLAAPATSAEYAGPTITAPVDGAVVDTAQAPVTADSAAPFVRFRINAQRDLASTHALTAVVPVDAGVATYDWATAGFSEAGIVATDCTTVEETSCAVPDSTPVTVTVDVPADTFTDPTGDVVVNPDVDGPLPVTVAASDAAGTVYVAWSADRDGTRTAVVPGSATDLDLSGFTGDPATGPLEIWRCSEVDETICTQTGTSEFDVTVRRAITMGPLTVDRKLFSPDGNGLVDTVTASVALEDAPGLRATWSLLDAEGAVAVPAQDIDVTDPADTSFTVDPAAAGATLATGGYTLVVDASAPGGKNGFTAQQTVPLDVDVDGPRPTAVAPTLSTVYPVEDGYRDEVGVTLTVEDARLGAGTATGGVIRVVDADGKVVRRFGRSDLPDGFTFAWDGRNSRKEIVPGRYTLEAVLTDDAGNRAKATSPAITVSGKELVRKSVTRTVSARASLVRNDSGRCSKLRLPGVHGWKGSIGYLSQATCKGTARGTSRVAAGVHGLRVPRAVRYHRVTVAAYGGASKKGTGDRAGLHFFGNQGLLGDTAVLRPKVGWHAAGGRLGSKMVSPQRYVYWAVSTGYGQRYDVKRFRVTVTYTALQ